MIPAGVLAAFVLAVLAIWISTRSPGGAPRAVARPDAGPPGPVLPRDRPVLPAPVRGAGSERLTGVIVDGAGAPVAALAVTAVLELPAGDRALLDDDRDAGAGAATAVVAITGSDGRFVLDGLVPGRHHLTIEGGAVFTAEVRFVPVPSDELRLVVARRVAVVGEILDGGRPVAGATVAIASDTTSGTRTVTSGADGRFAFTELPEGTYRVWAWKGDLAARAQAAPRLGTGPFEDLLLIMEPAAIVVGRVVDRQTGGGVAAAVMLTPVADDLMGDEAPRYARTGADGVFRVEGVPHGRWTADAWAPGWITIGSVDFAAGRGRPEVELVPGGIVEGRVVDAGGRPVAGVVVSAREDARGGGREVSAAADDDRLRRFSGRAVMAAPRLAGAAATGPGAAGDARFLPRGELGVLLGPIPFPPPLGAARTQQAAIVDDLSAGLGAGAGVASAGGVVAGGAVAPIAPDPAYVATWITGDDGRFRVTGVPAGSFWVIASAPGHAVARSRPLTLELGQVVTGVGLRLDDGRYVAGRVTSQRGAPVAGAILTFVPDGGPEQVGVVEAITDADGRYRAGPMSGAVRARVVAFGHGLVEQALDLAPAPGEDVSADRTFDVVLVAADAIVEGAVEDPAGLPVRDARIVVEGGAADGRSATSGDGGRFTVDRLPEGPLVLRVEHPDYPPQRFKQTTGDGRRLRLAYGGGLELIVFDRHTGQHLAGVAVVASGPTTALRPRRELATGAGGRLELVPIVAGAWTLSVEVPGYVRRSLAVDVPAGDRPAQVTARDLRLELERGALVAGLVRDRYGNRVAGAKVTVKRGDDALTATTDAEGEYRLRDVPTGTVEVTAAKQGATGTTSLELRPGDERLSVELTIL